MVLSGMERYFVELAIVALGGGAGALLASLGCCMGSRIGQLFEWGAPWGGRLRGSLLLAPSQCEDCGQPLGLACTPLIGWMVGCRSEQCAKQRRERRFRGRARGSPAWPLLEVSGALCGMAAVLQGWQAGLLALLVVPLCCAAAASDLRWRMIPEVLSVPLLVICLALSPFAEPEARIWGVAALAACGFLTVVLAPRRMVARVAGAWCGWRKWRHRRRAERNAGAKTGREAKPRSQSENAFGNGSPDRAGGTDVKAEIRTAEEDGSHVGWLRAELGIGGADCVLLAALGALGGIAAGSVVAVVCLGGFVAVMAGSGRAGRGSAGEPLAPWLAVGMMLVWVWSVAGWNGLGGARALGQELPDNPGFSLWRAG